MHVNPAGRVFRTVAPAQSDSLFLCYSDPDNYAARSRTCVTLLVPPPPKTLSCFNNGCYILKHSALCRCSVSLRLVIILAAHL